MGMGRTFMIVAAALVFGHASAAAERFACKTLSGGHAAAFEFAVDDQQRTLDVSSSSWFQPLPESVEITPAMVRWTFMRGFVDFDRKTRLLDWDMTAEFDYLTTIGQPPNTPRESFVGRMRCEPR